MNKQDALQILSSRKAISEPGKYRLAVSTCQDYFATRGEGDNTINLVAIANFRAMTPYHVEEAKAQLAEGKFQDACNNNLSLSIREGAFKPQKGEIVDVIVEHVDLKDGSKGLFVTSISEVKATTDIANVSFSMEEEGAEAPAASAETEDIA